jgi:hypothetical protein
VRGGDELHRPLLALRRKGFEIAIEDGLEGLLAFPLGMLCASALTRSSTKASCTYIGCSAQSVPSLSNTAMRSAGGTKSGEPCSVTLPTNATMDRLAAPSFQAGNGSGACARLAGRMAQLSTRIRTHDKRLRMPEPPW